MTSKGSEAAPIHRVMIEFPGYWAHKRVGRLVDAFEGDLNGFDLGILFTLDVDDTFIALPKERLRLLGKGG